MYTQSLNQPIDTNVYGAKGAHLSKMKRAGFPVPEGFVVSTTAFNLFFKEQQDKSGLIREMEQALNKIGATKYMVRSSAIGEDSEDHSFAGQLDSFITTSNLDDIMNCMQQCWAACTKENVQVYEQFAGKRLMGMGVVVQALIEPDYAGVIFTRSHLKEGHMLVEYVEGHGEKLVAGEVIPKSFHFSRSQSTTDKDYLPQLREGLKIAEQIEHFYGSPSDIEWALKDGVFYVVQARPITTAIKTKEVFWSNTNVNENYPDPITPLLYSVARDAYYNYFKNLSKLFRVDPEAIRSLEPEYANVIGVWGCKMYYNMSSIHAILSSSPFAGLLIKSFDKFVGYTAETQTARKHFGLLQKLSFAKEFVSLNRNLNKNVVEFENIVDDYSRNVKNAVVASEVRRTFHGFIEIRMHSWYRASLADFFAMIYHGLLGKFCSTYYGTEAAGVQNKLIQAIPGLISSRPILDMYDLIVLIRKNQTVYEQFQTLNEIDFWKWIQQQDSDILFSVHNYLENWGFRCSGELMLTVENYAEKPESFIALLQRYEKLPDQNPELLIQEKYREALQTQQDFRKKIWSKQGWFFPKALLHIGLLNFLIKQTGNGIASRERVRLKQAHLYFRFKQVLKKIESEWIKQGKLKETGDLLYLTYPELSEHLSASSMLHNTMSSTISQRKEEFKRVSALRYPDDFFTDSGINAQPEAVKQKAGVAGAEGELSGMCACGGIIEGRVKVLNSVLEAGKLERGDILVTRQTDPGWVVVFPLISGLIVERGGMLSHGAIVSREFGIPAIVGVESATTLLKDGDRIVLNAHTGKIIVCD